MALPAFVLLIAPNPHPVHSVCQAYSLSSFHQLMYLLALEFPFVLFMFSTYLPQFAVLPRAWGSVSTAFTLTSGTSSAPAPAPLMLPVVPGLSPFMLLVCLCPWLFFVVYEKVNNLRPWVMAASSGEPLHLFLAAVGRLVHSETHLLLEGTSLGSQSTENSGPFFLFLIFCWKC